VICSSELGAENQHQKQHPRATEDNIAFQRVGVASGLAVNRL
jgi:hypothetical protein